jgi:hypothetical protein
MLSIVRQLSLRLAAFQIVGLTIILFASASLDAQTLKLRLLNAKSGKPMRNENVTIRWDNLEGAVVSVDKKGIAILKVPSKVKQFAVIPGPRKGSEPYRSAYTNCNNQISPLVSVTDVVNKGVVRKNICGPATATSSPGEIVFWALPRGLVSDFQ